MTSPVISAAELHAHLGDSNLRIIDATVHLSFDESGAHVASGASTFAEGHIPGAVFIDQRTAVADHSGEAPFAAVESEVFAEAMGALGISNDSNVVVTDHANGIWATRLWWQFRLEGFDVRVLDGGFAGWRAAGFPVTTETRRHEPATFIAHRRDQSIASTEEVEAATGSERMLLINALDEDAFQQARIPGSVNVPVTSLINPDGTLKSVEALRQAFDAVGALDDRVSPVAYCGGGIAATAVTWALAAVGRDDVAVYDGSMNAWTADPERPLETTP